MTVALLTEEQIAQIVEQAIRRVLDQRAPPEIDSLTEQEAATALSLSLRTVQRRVKEGLLPRVPGLGKTVRIPRSALIPKDAEVARLALKARQS